MEETAFYHALQINENLCIGCSHCMRNCPTEAIRIRKGKACLYPNRCIDCGICYKVCPVSAIEVTQDDFKDVFKYKHRVALIPAVFVAQFSDFLQREINSREVYEGLLALGFTDVFEIEHLIDFLSYEVEEYMNEHSHIRPLISTFCPAVVRLIQVKFPALTENLILKKQPSEVAAMYCKQKWLKQGATESEIGIFYISPCAAKIVAIKNPVGENRSEICGVLNMDFLFNQMSRYLKVNKPQGEADQADVHNYISPKGLLWSLTEGESRYMVGRSLAMDGIEHVSEYLEKLEDTEDSDIDFLELKGCDQGCPGGILVRGIRFLIADEMRRRAFQATSKENYGVRRESILDEEILQKIKPCTHTAKVHPRSMMKLDSDIQIAIKKMEQIKEILKLLPKKDCGVCGAPSCVAFAEDIAHEKAKASHCVFLQTVLEDKGNMSPEERVDIFKHIWGEDIFEKAEKK